MESLGYSLGFFAGFVVLLISALCLIAWAGDTKKIPFGIEYYVVSFISLYVITVCLLLLGKMNMEYALLLLAMLAGFLSLPSILLGLKTKCFFASYTIICIGGISLIGYACGQKEVSIIIALAPAACVFIVCSLRNYGFYSENPETVNEDLLNRTEEYDGLLEEIRVLADPTVKEMDTSNSENKSDVNGINIALCSPWGSGKSHFFNYLRVYLRKKKEKGLGWEDAFSISNVDVWKIQREEELWKEVNNVLLRAILGMNGSIAYLVEQNLFRAIFQHTTEGKSVQLIYDLIYRNNDAFSLDLINQKLKNRRVLLIFEDIERARPEIIEALLPLLDRLRRMNNVFSLCSLDKEELQSKINNSTSIKNYQSYMSKVFDRNIYLSPAEPRDIGEMLSTLLKSRFNDKSLVPMFLNAFYHRFETPRCMLRTLDALESLERLYFRNVFKLQGLSFDEVDSIDELFKLFIVFEVEVIRCNNPDLLQGIITKGGIKRLLEQCGNDDLANILNKGSDDFSVAFSSLPPNMVLYRNVKDKIIEDYPEMMPVIVNYGCSLLAIAHMHKYREKENIDAYFEYAASRAYMSERSFINKLKDGLLRVEMLTSSHHNSGEEIIDASSQNKPLRKKKAKESNQVQIEPIPAGVFANIDNYIQEIDVLKRNFRANLFYPYQVKFRTDVTHEEYANLLLGMNAFHKTNFLDRNQLKKSLISLYKTMDIATQAHFLRASFHLMRYSNKAGFSGRFSSFLADDKKSIKFIGELCVLYAENIVAYIFLEERKKNTVYYYYVQAYKDCPKLELFSSFYRGIDRALAKKRFGLFKSLYMLVDFLGEQYISPDYSEKQTSSFATANVVKMAEYVYQRICSKNSRGFISDMDKSRLRERGREVVELLRSDFENWKNNSRLNNEEYLIGIDSMISLVKRISYL